MRRVTFFVGLLAAAMSDFAVPLDGAEVSVGIDASILSEWTVDPLLFGSFYEEHWGDVTPGVYEQYLINPSFEKWYKGEREQKTRLVFPTLETRGIAFPWEPFPPTSPARYSLSHESVNSSTSQQISVEHGAAGGVVQQVALPDYRVTRYRLRFHARKTGTIEAWTLLLPNGEGTRAVNRRSMEGLTEQWRVFQFEVDLRGTTSQRHLGHFGVARLAFVASGNGTLLVDQATLLPVDAVEGRFNPETLEHLRTYGTTLIRWPGGNYTSGYHWRDGVGAVDKRPTRPNRPWGGLADNHVGTDEWLRFCELARLTPTLCVGFGEITPSEAADWVEYCNGEPSTPNGALRAQNGHKEPYHVKYWGIGNEVYGTYQIGHTDAETYAKGLIEMARAMRERDPAIQIIAVGLGVHNKYRRPESVWNETVLKIAGHTIDLVDVHHYVKGAAARHVRVGEAKAVTRAFLASSEVLEQYYHDYRRLRDATPLTSSIGLVHHEWAVLPRQSLGSPRRQSFANALCTASHYNTLLRNGDLVRQGALHNFSYFVNTTPSHSEPPNPRTHISRIYSALAGGRLLKTEVAGPTYSTTRDYGEIGRLHDVSEVDVIAVMTCGGRRLQLLLVNRSLDEDHLITVDVGGEGRLETGRVHLLESDDILEQYTWQSDRPVFTSSEIAMPFDGNRAQLKLPRHSFAHITSDLRETGCSD